MLIVYFMRFSSFFLGLSNDIYFAYNEESELIPVTLSHFVNL